MDSNENSNTYIDDKEFQNGNDKIITHIIDNNVDKKSTDEILDTV